MISALSSIEPSRELDIVAMIEGVIGNNPLPACPPRHQRLMNFCASICNFAK